MVIYTWSFQRRLIDIALKKGLSGYLAKSLPAGELVDALERIRSGEIVVSPAIGRFRATVGLDWPGRTEGLTDREAEIIALITHGDSNAEIAELTFLSMNTVKTYIRNAYRKMGVASRTQAVIWGIEHGFQPE
ncbi:MAG: response regulator transcription factor [Ilumatobacteraceae bacterium]